MTGDGLSRSLNDMWRSVVLYLPTVLVSLLILIVGYLLARLARTVTTKALRRAGFDRIVRSGPAGRLLRPGTPSVTDVCARLVFFVVLLFALQAAFGVWGPNPASDLITALISWLPQVLVAIVIVVVTIAIARAAHDLVLAVLGGLGYARVLAKAAAAVIVTLGVIAGLDQISIATSVTRPLLITVLATVAGVIIVGVGGGLVRPMQQRWERWLERAATESAVIRSQARAYAEERSRQTAEQEHPRTEPPGAPTESAGTTHTSGAAHPADPPPHPAGAAHPDGLAHPAGAAHPAVAAYATDTVHPGSFTHPAPPTLPAGAFPATDPASPAGAAEGRRAVGEAGMGSGHDAVPGGGAEPGEGAELPEPEPDGPGRDVEEQSPGESGPVAGARLAEVRRRTAEARGAGEADLDAEMRRASESRQGETAAAGGVVAAAGAVAGGDARGPGGDEAADSGYPEEGGDWAWETRWAEEERRSRERDSDETQVIVPPVDDRLDFVPGFDRYDDPPDDPAAGGEDDTVFVRAGAAETTFLTPGVRPRPSPSGGEPTADLTDEPTAFLAGSGESTTSVVTGGADVGDEPTAFLAGSGESTTTIVTRGADVGDEPTVVRGPGADAAVMIDEDDEERTRIVPLPGARVGTGEPTVAGAGSGDDEPTVEGLPPGAPRKP